VVQNDRGIHETTIASFVVRYVAMFQQFTRRRLVIPHPWPATDQYQAAGRRQADYAAAA
jgi:hypothetical protein